VTPTPSGAPPTSRSSRGAPDHVDVRLPDILRDAVPYALPLTRPFRGITTREGMLIRGPSGWGDFAPFDDYSPARSAPWLACAVEAAFGSWPEPRREIVPVNAIVPAVSAHDAAAIARQAVLEHGCTTIKVKVAAMGEVLADDEARVAAVRHAADSAAASASVDPVSIRLDANGGWSADDAARALGRLVAYGIEYVEQPCASIDETLALRPSLDVPIALDESVRFGDPRAFEAADIVILKVAPLGGVAAALALARSWGGPVVVSGALDSAVGLASGLALAASLAGDPPACGLGTGALLARDVIAPPLVPFDGHLPVERIAPDLDALMWARDQIGDDRARWWRQRLVDAWESGGAGLVEDLGA
jgi:O-succinylbenzoate synthase